MRPPHRRPSLPLLLAAASLACSLAACRDGAVRVAFRPEERSRADYRVTVEARVVTVIADRPERRTEEADVFTARHTVLDAGDDGTDVEVRLESEGEEPRSFVVRLDRAGQLVEVQRIEGIPADALGELGLSEIFPAAAAAPPDRPLAPGDRWSIDEPVAAEGRARIRGRGRLVELTVADGRRQATIESEYVLPVDRETEESGRPLRLQGEQRTRVTTTHDVADGSVVSAVAETTGRFRLLLLAPAGGDGPPVPGRVEVDVRSTTTRLR